MAYSLDGASICTPLTERYGLRHPFVCAGMGFVAHERLAGAVSNAGGLGASPDSAASLPVMVGSLRELTDRPFGIDLICAQTGWAPPPPTSTSPPASS